MYDCFLINPLAQTKKGHAHFIRDWCGGENVISMVFPPLELAQTAALLRKNGFRVGLIDASALHLTHKKVVELISRQKPRFIGIPSAWASIDDDIYLARLMKEAFPEAKIIFYGVNVTAEPQSALDSGVVDYVILGEPEMTFLKIMQGKAEENIASKKDSGIVKNKISLLANLDELPFPARDLLPNRHYRSPFTKSNPFTFMYSSRGCSYRCKFCPCSIWNLHQVRYRNVESVILEIKEVVERYKIRDIIFRDPSLTIKRDHVLALCEGILKSGHKINWRCFSHVNDVDAGLLKLMKKAGCYQISYGFESASQDILQSILKSVHIEQALKSAQLTKEAGIELSGSFMLGLPGETKKTINETIRFSKRLKLDYAQFQFAIAVPGTRLYEEQLEGRYSAITQDRQKWHWSEWEGFIEPKSDSAGMLKWGLRKAYRNFYFNPAYLFSQMGKIRNFEQLLLNAKVTLTLMRQRLA